MSQIPPEADTGFDPRKVRGITDVQRSSDDRVVAGVCTGVARFLNVDPVVVRVALVALTFVGFAGVILYLAAWLFLPSDDGQRSHAAQWFKLGENEEQVRVVGLIIAGIIAITSGSGMIGGDWGRPFPWFGLIVLGIVYVFLIRPAQHRRERRVEESGTGAAAPTESVTRALPVREPRTPWSPALTFITLSASLIAMGGVALWAEANDPVPWTAYAVAALGVIGLGLLVGTLWGNAGLLIPLGGLIALSLAVSTLLPSARIGHDVYPAGQTSIASSYRLGIGQLDLNLDKLDNPSMLEGRTIRIEVGIGQSRIIVPAAVNVEIRSTLHAGEIRIFDRAVNGTQNRLDYEAEQPLAEKLTLDISQSFGNIEVIKQ